MSSRRRSFERRVESLALQIRDSADAKRGVTNDLINDFCQEICSLEPQNLFAGVYSVDQIPVNALARRKFFCIIINLASREKRQLEGHFVCICVHPTSCFYIDPFGLPNLMSEIVYFLKRCSRPVFYNRKQIQHMKSPFCGMYVALFATYYNDPLGETRRLRLRFEDGGKKRNDRRCMTYLKKLVDEIYENVS